MPISIMESIPTADPTMVIAEAVIPLAAISCQGLQGRVNIR